jgi:hypothetical protein
MSTLSYEHYLSLHDQNLLFTSSLGNSDIFLLIVILMYSFNEVGELRDKHLHLKLDLIQLKPDGLAASCPNWFA